MEDNPSDEEQVRIITAYLMKTLRPACSIDKHVSTGKSHDGQLKVTWDCPSGPQGPPGMTPRGISLSRNERRSKTRAARNGGLKDNNEAWRYKKR